MKQYNEANECVSKQHKNHTNFLISTYNDISFRALFEIIELVDFCSSSSWFHDFTPRKLSFYRRTILETVTSVTWVYFFKSYGSFEKQLY